MLLDLKEIHPNTLNIICFPEDENYFYGFSRYYNELFLVDIEKKIMHSLGRLENEEDAFDLIFNMIYCHGKILLIPRNACNFHLYDIKTKEQKTICPSDFSRQVLDHTSFFQVVHGHMIYLICRNGFSIYKLNTDCGSVEYIAHPYEQAEKVILNASVYKDQIALFTGESNLVYIFDGLREKIREIALDTEAAMHTSQYFDGNYIWLFHNRNNSIYKCDLEGKIIKSFELKRTLKKDGLLFKVCKKDGSIFWLPNIQDYYYEISNDKLVFRQFRQGGLCQEARYLVGENSRYQYYMSFPLESDGRVPVPGDSILKAIKYRRMDKRMCEYEDYLMPVAQNKSTDTARRQIYKNIMPVFPDRCVENDPFSLALYLDIIVMADDCNLKREECINTIGKSIYQEMKYSIKG